MRSTQRGMVLGIVVVMAFIAAVASYTILLVAASQARQGQFWRQRFRARYAAEAGIVWAMERLWANQAYCGAPDPPPFDTDGDGVADTTVDVTMSGCGGGAANRTISAAVTYNEYL